MTVFNIFTAIIIFFSIDCAASDIVDVSILDAGNEKWKIELTFCGTTRNIVVDAPQNVNEEQKLVAALVSQAKKECIK